MGLRLTSRTFSIHIFHCMQLYHDHLTDANLDLIPKSLALFNLLLHIKTRAFHCEKEVSDCGEK